MIKKKILITGGSGFLGKYLCNYYLKKEFLVFGTSNLNQINIDGVEEVKVDLLDFDLLKKSINKIKPEIIIHTAALTNVDECERNPEAAYSMNVQVTQEVCSISKELGSKFIHISTDHLWDGKKTFINEEEDYSPLNIYGKTKAEAEKSVIRIDKNSLIIRTNFFAFAMHEKKSLADWIVENLKKDLQIKGFDDVFFTPISINFLTEYINCLIDINASGVFNIVGKSRISKYQFALYIAEHFRLNKELISKASIKDVTLLANRPLDMSLSVDKVSSILKIQMPDIRECINSLK